MLSQQVTEQQTACHGVAGLALLFWNICAAEDLVLSHKVT